MATMAGLTDESARDLHPANCVLIGVP
jgi:hypothetical protein